MHMYHFIIKHMGIQVAYQIAGYAVLTVPEQLVDRMAELALDPKGTPVFISHGDCPEDAQTLAQMVRERFGVREIVINYIGPVIGAHSGPGTLALFYIGTER